MLFLQSQRLHLRQKAAFFQERGRVSGDSDHGAQGYEEDVVSCLKHFRLADGQDFRRGGKGYAGAASPGIADDGGAVLVVVHGAEHVDEFRFILGLHEDDVRNAADHGDVKQAVVGGKTS